MRGAEINAHNHSAHFPAGLSHRAQTPQPLFWATWGVGAICGYIELTETLVISHKLVKQKAREKTTSVEVAFGNEFRPPRKALNSVEFNKS